MKKKKNLTVKEKNDCDRTSDKSTSKERNKEGRPQGEKDWKKTYLGKK